MSFRDYQKKVLASQRGEKVDWDAPAAPAEPSAASVETQSAVAPSGSTSPFRDHQQRVAAAMIADATNATGIAPEIDEASPAAGQYRVLLVSLHDDLRKLSDIASHEARIPEKARMLETYRAWVDGAVAAGVGGAATQDEIVAEALVWAIDITDYDYALAIAGHMIANGVNLPQRFSEKSTVASFLVKRVAEAALKPDGKVPLPVLQSVSSLTHDHDMHDEARADLMKALSRGYAAAAESFDPAADNAVAGGKAALVQAALVHANRALELNKNAGVKKDIEKLTRQLNDLGGPPPAEETQTNDADGDEIEHPQFGDEEE